jgi:hypothetical protein
MATRDASRFCLIAVAWLLVMVLAGCNGGNGEPAVTETPEETITPPPAAADHQLFITVDGPKCKVADAGGNVDIHVQAGDWVVWTNNYGSDVQLTFGPSKRLFGVLKAIVYADGSPLRLQVREDANLNDGDPHKYNTNCGATLPGPGIIVDPPN